MRKRGEIIRCGMITLQCVGAFLQIELPSGRKLSYPYPRIIKDDRGNSRVLFADNGDGQFRDCRDGDGAYGGTWTENIVSGIARDMLVEAMLRVEAAAIQSRFMFTMSLVCEVPIGFGSEEEFAELMTSKPDWAGDLPIAAERLVWAAICEVKRWAARNSPPLSFLDLRNDPMSETELSAHLVAPAKLPAALSPLVALAQWCVWRGARGEDGRWRPASFVMAADPARLASVDDPATWCDYATAAVAVQRGEADGIAFVLTTADPFVVIDLGNCRHPRTGSIDVWAQNFLDVTPPQLCRGDAGRRRLRDLGIVRRGHVGSELGVCAFDRRQAHYRRAAPVRHRRIVAVTGLQLNAVEELANIDKGVDWALVWGDRREAAAAVAAGRRSARMPRTSCLSRRPRTMSSSEPAVTVASPPLDAEGPTIPAI